MGRDFTLLWTGQTCSNLGAAASSIAFPLLVLAVTGSAFKAGLVGFVHLAPLPLLALPAGAIADRLDRRWLMISADACRLFVMASLALVIWLNDVTFWYILFASFVSGVCWVFFWVCENAALKHVVGEPQLPHAVALNQGRQYASALAGPPLGGALYAVGRALPFAADSVSYAISLTTTAFIRTPLQESRTRLPSRRMAAEIKGGLQWLWREPRLRATSLLLTGSDFALNALYLVLVVTAREDGFSATEIGVMLGIVGASGMIGALWAPWLSRRTSFSGVVIGVQVLTAALVPLLLTTSNTYARGVIYGAVIAAWPTWNASVRSYQFAVTPDPLQGRVQSVSLLLSNGAVPLAPFFAGLLLALVGPNRTLIAFSALLGIVAAAAASSRAIRSVSHESSSP